MQDLWKRINWMTREEIVSHLEGIGIACYDDESTQELRECLHENASGDNPSIEL